MADGKVTIDTELNNKGLNKGLKDSGSKLKDFAKTAGKAGVTAAAAAVSIKAIAAGVKDVTEAYKGQIKSEKMLESASKNNPYLDSRSVQQLKEYADNIQSLTGHDNVLIQEYMTMLAGAGRTQEQIQEIISASADLASAGLMDMGTAVKELSKSYEGQGRTLKMLIPAVNSLTEEEMKQGRAIDVIKKAYGGLAEETFAATGAAEKLANAWGDAKKELGAPIEKALAPARELFAELINGWTEAARARREYLEAKEKRESGKEDASSIQKEIDFLEKQKELAEETLERIENASRLQVFLAGGEKVLEKAKEQQKKIIDNLQEQIDLYEEERDVKQEIEDENNKLIQQETELAEKRAKQKERDEKAQEHIDSVTKALADQLEAMRVNAELRKEDVDTAEELNAYMSAYVDLVVKSNGLVTENHTVAKNMLGTIKEMADAEAKKTKSLEEQAELKEAMEEFYDFLGELQDELSEIDFFKNQIKELEKRKDDAIKLLEKRKDDAIKLKNIEADEKLKIEKEFSDEKLKIEKEFAEAKAKLDEKTTQLEKEQQRERIDNYISIAKEFADEYANAMNNITRLASEGVEARAYLSTKEAEKMYNDGEIGYEEYQEKLSDIDKESAKQRHKIAMWEWGVQLVQAIANSAVAFNKALSSSTPPLNFILAGLVASAGAAQIALITANKPVAPSFATGGIVGGTSYTGDRVQANVNSGEMILTYAQQKRLFDIANGGRTGGNVQVFNSASNDVNVRPEITPEGVRILIRKVVNEDMASGRYNRSYKKMRGGLNGVRLTN